MNNMHKDPDTVTRHVTDGPFALYIVTLGTTQWLVAASTEMEAMSIVTLEPGVDDMNGMKALRMEGMWSGDLGVKIRDSATPPPVMYEDSPETHYYGSRRGWGARIDTGEEKP